MTSADPTPASVAPPRLPARPLTLDDVSALAAVDDAHRYELDEGNLVVMAPPDAEHIVIVTRLLMWLINHGYADDRVLTSPGVRIRDQVSGRCPDLAVLGRAVPGDTVWIDPDALILVVEVVSRASEKLDRDIKPMEYARAGIRQYWRVERDGPPTVHIYQLCLDERGERAYLKHEAVLLDSLLDGDPPTLD